MVGKFTCPGVPQGKRFLAQGARTLFKRIKWPGKFVKKKSWHLKYLKKILSKCQ